MSTLDQADVDVMKENAISLQRQIDAMLASFALPVEKVKKENKYVERQMQLHHDALSVLREIRICEMKIAADQSGNRLKRANDESCFIEQMNRLKCDLQMNYADIMQQLVERAMPSDVIIPIASGDNINSLLETVQL